MAEKYSKKLPDFNYNSSNPGKFNYNSSNPFTWRNDLYTTTYFNFTTLSVIKSRLNYPLHRYFV